MERWGERLRLLLASPHLAGGIAVASIAVYFSFRFIFGPEVLTRFIAWTGLSPDFLIPTALLATVYFVHLLATAVSSAKLLEFRGRLHYDYVDFDWDYGLGGDLEGRCIYRVVNASDEVVDVLPSEGMLWYSDPIKPETRFRILWRDGDRRHHFENASPKADKFAVKFNPRIEHSSFDLTWSPVVRPPLQPGETLTYQVEIYTPNTELAAFEPSGSHVGCPIKLPTKWLRVHCAAPRGMKFSLMEPAISVLDLVAEQNFPQVEGSLRRPELSIDSTRITWRVDYPKVGYRYWVNFRIESL